MLKAPPKPPARRRAPAPRKRAAEARAAVFLRNGDPGGAHGHDLASKAQVAQRLAGLLGYRFVGEVDLDHLPAAGPRPYFVPSETLLDLKLARRLGIRGPADLFGGVVPHAFVATKLISHPLVEPGAAAPPGWSSRFGRSVADVVLPGHAVFSVADARKAGLRLLDEGSVRLKDPAGVGGSGQWVARNVAELEACLGQIDPAVLAQRGLALECNLNQVVTHSIGEVRVGEHVAAYCGTQNSTHNHRGEAVYGGSQLLVARGGFEQLARLALEPAARTALDCALRYHHAALASFTGMFASRCNYDVAAGIDDQGRPRCGVLEQSWRIGGASGAEVSALEAFAADPGLQVVQARTCEVYGEAPRLPPDAWILFDGTDERVGRLVKYACWTSADVGHA